MDKFASLLDAAEETSTLFMPSKLSLRSFHTNGRKIVRKRIELSLVAAAKKNSIENEEIKDKIKIEENQKSCLNMTSFSKS